MVETSSGAGGRRGLFGAAAPARPTSHISPPAWLAAAAVAATALDQAGRLTGGAPVTAYQVVLAAGLLVLAWRIASERLSWRRTPLDLPLAVFFGAVFAATLAGLSVAFDPLTLAKVASSVALMVLVVQAVRTAAERELVVKTLLVTVAVSALYALAARFAGLSAGIMTGGVARTSGTFDDPNIFGALLVVGLAVGGGLWLDDPRWRRPWVAAAALPVLSALLFTFSRGALAAAAAAALFLICGSRRPAGWKVSVLVAAVAAVALVAAMVVPPEFIRDKVAGVASDPSTTVRFYMWRSSFQMSWTYPLGIGPGAFPEVYPLFRARGTAPGLVESHNAYLTLLVELGVLGLAAAAWLVWRFGRLLAAVLRSGPSDRALALGVSAASLAIAVQAMTYSLEFSKPLWITLALGLLAYLVPARRFEGGAACWEAVDGDN